MFTYVDLFAGVGGFHAALGSLGGEAVFASEIDAEAVAVYERNWGTPVAGDIVPLTEDQMAVPRHDVLAAGFPCQPFSKSGYQRGMAETRGTLFWNICRVLDERKPGVILLENVRNLAGPRHAETWKTIVASLRDLGYNVAGRPTVFSPHNLPLELGGRPQTRDRVFITGTYVGRERAWAEATDQPLVANHPVGGWDPRDWNLRVDLPVRDDVAAKNDYGLNATETEWIDTWDRFVHDVGRRSPKGRLPGFPIWADAFVVEPEINADTPVWKADFLRKNSDLYLTHKSVIDKWRQANGELAHFPASRRKLEWQAQDAKSLWDTVMHFRPSGIRAKMANYLPALVAITQTSVVGSLGRRITPREAARLQGLPDWFDFGAQSDAATYRQMGNGVNVGAAYYILRQRIARDYEDVSNVAPGLVKAFDSAPQNPDEVLQAAPRAVELQRLG
jgi:DNA (cytosine-5)-methyltransferase 1